MLSVIGKLSACGSSKEVEAACELLTLEVLQGAKKEERVTLKEVLESIDGNSILTDSAKLRRRVKRLIETLDVKLDRAKPADKPVSRLADKQQGGAAKPPAPRASSAPAPSAAPLTMGEAVKCLHGARSIREVEAALNNLRLPEKVDGRHSQEFLEHRERLGAALGKVAADSSLSNALVRKRIKKFCFVLASEEEQSSVKRLQSAKALAAPHAAPGSVLGKRQSGQETVSSGISTRSRPQPAVATVAVVQGKSLEDTLRDVRQAATAEDVDSALSNFTEASMLSCRDDTLRRELLALLQAKVEGDLNAKVRRKVKRVVEMMQKSSLGSAVVAAGGGSSSSSSSSSSSKRDISSSSSSSKAKLVIPAQPLQAPQQPQQQGPVSFLPVLAALKAAASAADIEAALALLPLPAVFGAGDAEQASAVAQVRALLAGMLTEGAAVALNSALKRRTKRALEGLPAAEQARSAAPPAAAEMVKVHNPPPGRDLTQSIADVQAAQTGAALLAGLEQLLPGDGNTTTRRKLSRHLQGLLSSGLGGLPLTAYVAERCQAVVASLQPSANSGAKLLPVEEARALGLLEPPGKKAKVGNAAPSDKPPATPHIIFIGQISFETTAAEVETMVRSGAGVEGAIKVRLLSEPSGQSRGMAFVELESAAEQHQCLALHHTIFNGRKINVEKSAGGRGEKKKEKLSSLRVEQRGKVQEKIDTILAEYARSGVLSGLALGGAESLLMQRFYGYTPSHVQAILANFERAKANAGGGSSSESYASYTSSADANQQVMLDKVMDSFDAKMQRLSGKRKARSSAHGEEEEEEVEEEDVEMGLSE